MRKDILWEPFFILAFHLKMTNYSEFYKMPVRMRNWLLERTVEEYKKQNEFQENDAKGMRQMSEPNSGDFKLFKNE